MPAANGWSADLFRYERPAKLIVEESTPTVAQSDWHTRPPQMKADERNLVATGPAKPRVVEQMNILRLRFKDADGEIVPVLLCTPAGKQGPVPRRRRGARPDEQQGPGVCARSRRG